MKNATAYLSFDGNCRQVMSFYQRCLGGDLAVNNYPDASGRPSSDPAARVMHAQLLLQGAPIVMASDTPEPGSLRQGDNFSIALECESRAEAQRLFSALAEKGEVRLALMDAPWGALFGMLTDQFGVQWMLNCFAPQPD